MKRIAMLGALLLAACARPAPPPKTAVAPAKTAIPDELRLDKDPTAFVGDDRSLDSTASPLNGRLRKAPDVAWRLPTEKLPRLGKERAPTGSDGAHFEYSPQSEGLYHFVVHRDLLAEATIGSTRVYTGAVEARVLRDTPASFDFEPTIQENPNQRGPIECGKRTSAPRQAFVRGLVTSEWTDDSLSYVEYPASFDQSVCQGKATSIREGKASALWPGVVYAFLADDDEYGTRALHIVSAAASWLAASPVTPTEARTSDGSFSHVRVRLSARAATIVLELPSSTIWDFAHARTTKDRASELPPPVATCPNCPVVRVVIDADDHDLAISVERLAPSALVDALLPSDVRPARTAAE